MCDTNLTFIALCVCGDEVLLLKRTQPPLCWGPPSGHVKAGEPMAAAIAREMAEETGNTCEVLMAVDTWEGLHRGRQVFNVTYVCEMPDHRVQLSEEHSDFRWIPLDRLQEAQDMTLLPLADWPLLVRLAREYTQKRRQPSA